MSYNSLDRQIANKTGDDLKEIRRLGFSLIDPNEAPFDPPTIYRPQMVNWDELDRFR